MKEARKLAALAPALPLALCTGRLRWLPHADHRAWWRQPDRRSQGGHAHRVGLGSRL